MKLSFLLSLSAILLVTAAQSQAAAIPVVVSAQAAPVERAAAEELAGYLGRIYPEERFALSEQLPASGRAILLGAPATEPRLKSLLASLPTAPESFTVATAGDVGVIAGADSRGVVYGVYGLLEKLGCGFYLSYETLAPARSGAFSLEGWQLSNRPAAKERLVLNWHNFLSGCSAWNLEDWNRWTLQSQKQGFNGIIVHAYGNNPMASYSFNGKTKPVGYLSSTVKGRDWSTSHLNDVRKIWGGEVFSKAVFGADAAQVPDEQRVDAAKKLMSEAFDYAAERSMEVYFAVDVDTPFANPQELIMTLPASARFSTVDKHGYGTSTPNPPILWLANPETPEGYQFYRTQVEELMKAYPKISCFVAWFRPDPTAWVGLKVEQLPADWQTQYREELAKTPEAKDLPHSVGMFAIGKMVRAYQRALKELGHEQVEVAAGSWRFDYARAANRFMPTGVKLLALNFEIYNGKQPESVVANAALLPEVGAHRPIVPIFWAHHDDGTYIGRAYPPTVKLHSRLSQARASGFGIIHWTTRPLDLFFTAQMKQVWQNSLDQSLALTCQHFAERSFGESAKAAMANYLERWAVGAPAFGRDTSDQFISHPITDVEKKIAGCEQRIKILESVDQSQLTAEQRERWSYFQRLERFIIAFHREQDGFQKAEAFYNEGQFEQAKALLLAARPEEVVQEYARFSSLGGITPGEQGLVLSMNTRWLTHFVRLRQLLGLTPIRYQFGPTSHDPLAQGEGRFTFFFDERRQLWQTLGTKHTGAATFIREAETTDLCRSGIESEKPIRFIFEPIMFPSAKGLWPGRYIVRLWMRDPASSATGERVFDLSLRSGVAAKNGFSATEKSGSSVSDRIDMQSGGTARVLVREYPITVAAGEKVELRLTPVAGKALLCAAELEPVASDASPAR